MSEGDSSPSTLVKVGLAAAAGVAGCAVLYWGYGRYVYDPRVLGEDQLPAGVKSAWR